MLTRAEAANRPEPEAPVFAAARIAQLFAPWQGARKILLAVSGGPDSTALMLLAAAWAPRGGPALHVATVDHGLRREARHEAEQVGASAGELGLPHDILVWDGDRPTTRIQERAREARYRLLFAHAARIGADVVATGHHADDQAETILFRLARGSGVGGLAGMAASRERLGLIHARPLLQCSKTELMQCCAAYRHGFLNDPSNRDPAFARTRLRALSGLLDEAGLSRDALLRLGRRAARAEAALAARAAVVASALTPEPAADAFRANVSMLAREPEEIVLRVLAGAIAASGGPARPLRLDRLETLAASFHTALAAGAPFSATLGGAALRLDGRGMLTIRAEAPRRRGVSPAPACAG